MTYIHPYWRASITGATWVWKDAIVQNPSQNETANFSHTFVIPNTPTNGLLRVAIDNGGSMTLNGNPISLSDNTFYYGPQNINVLPFLVAGLNVLNITVNNWGADGSTYQSNPAGIKYRIDFSY